MNNHRIPPKPLHFNSVPAGTCRWCNQLVGLTAKGKPSKSRWHLTCVEIFKFLFWPSHTRKIIWSRDKGKCRICQTMCDKKGPGGWQLDHIVPLISGNGDLSFWQSDNLQTLCQSCHKSKTSQEAKERADHRKQIKINNQKSIDI